MDMRQPDGSLLPASLDTGHMSVVIFVQCLVPLQAIGLDGRSVLHVRLDEGDKGYFRKVRDELQANATSHFTAVLYSPRDKRLASCAAATLSRLRPPDVCLIYFDDSPQWLAIRRDHRSSQLVEHRPGSFVSVQSQLPLELECRHSWRVGRHKVRGPEPVGQRHACSVQNCPCSHRSLQTARLALHQVSPRETKGFGVPASWTAGAIRPTARYQVLPARRFVREPSLELPEGFRKIRAWHGTNPTPGGLRSQPDKHIGI